MNGPQRQSLCLESVKAENRVIPALRLIAVKPRPLNDAMWPLCAGCGGGVSTCECAEYEPLIAERGVLS